MLDLDAYLDRIGLTRPATASLPALQALVAGHVASIPFENLDIALGRPVRIDIGSVQRKLVRCQRGGYCFEQNLLLQAALEALGFATCLLMARVVLGGSETDERPRTHVAVRVTLPEGAYLADAGIGGLSPVAPLALVADRSQATKLESYRFVVRQDHIVLQAYLAGEWRPVYRFSEEPSPAIDHVVANWFTSTCPESRFTNVVMAALPGPGCRRTLFNTRLTVRGTDGTKTTRQLASAAETQAALRSHFNLSLPEEDAERLFAVMRRCAEKDDPAFRMEP